jgi:hypothetical protein
VSADAARIWRQASTPPIPGIRKSIKTILGLNSRHILTIDEDQPEDEDQRRHFCQYPDRTDQWIGRSLQANGRVAELVAISQAAVRPATNPVEPTSR